MKEHLKDIQYNLVCMMKEELEEPEQVCSKELYEIMDIIKDISETMYYETIIEAMENGTTIPMEYHKMTPSATAAIVKSEI